MPRYALFADSLVIQVSPLHQFQLMSTSISWSSHCCLVIWISLLSKFSFENKTVCDASARYIFFFLCYLSPVWRPRPQLSDRHCFYQTEEATAKSKRHDIRKDKCQFWKVKGLCFTMTKIKKKKKAKCSLIFIYLYIRFGTAVILC